MSIKIRDSLEEAVTLIVSTPTGGITEGDFVQLQDTNGFALVSKDLDSDSANYGSLYSLCTYARKAVVSKAHGSGAASFTQGDKVYYDTTAENATDEVTGNVAIGFANADADSDATEVEIEFIGRNLS